MSGSISGLPPIPLYLAYSGNEASYAARAEQASPITQTMLAHFQAAAPGITSPAALLADYKSLSVVLGAFNMSNQIGNTAILQQLMTQNPSSTSSLAYKLGNPNFIRFAQQMSNWNPPPLASAANVAAIRQAYLTNQFEQGTNGQAGGMQDALYFTRTIGSVTTLNGLMSDASLLRVVVTGLGLPVNDFGALSFTQQSAILKTQVHFKDFTNAAWVKQTAEQYLVAQQQSASATPAPGTLAGLFSNAGNATNLFQILGATAASSSGSLGIGSLLSGIA